jgi:hypothetical protein
LTGLEKFAYIRTYLRAQEVDKWNGRSARQSHPNPDLPANVLKSNTASEHGNKREEPFSECTGCGTNVTEF